MECVQASVIVEGSTGGCVLYMLVTYCTYIRMSKQTDCKREIHSSEIQYICVFVLRVGTYCAHRHLPVLQIGIAKYKAILQFLILKFVHIVCFLYFCQ
nr:hypothetical protein WNSECMFO_WNSECMFO_CDS_0005 [Microvirus sp.]